MRTLYESIISSNGAGVLSRVKDIILDTRTTGDEINVKELNELWRKLGLGFDAGLGEGEWIWDVHQALYSIKYDKNKPNLNYFLAQIGAMNGSDVVICYHDSTFGGWKGFKKTPIKKWAEKISRILQMNMTIEKEYIYLNF